ncbi:hypothetical protein MRBLWO14_002462 [Microbacterium sp. LWO14-1.2]|uniref:hypothetical protein n=1 Tax=unclassified Microbacterium TaxID=2609290 RepID=UPI0031393412
MSRHFDDPGLWAGQLEAYEPAVASIILRAPLQRARSSGAGAFLGIADDGLQYWFKVPGNPQGNYVLANEVIVEGVGALIGAPVCKRALATITTASMTWDMYPGPPVPNAVTAHASRHVGGAIDDDALGYTRRDDNARRQAALVALWDWCLGDDEQWLYEAAAQSSVWSYDHGLWFTTGEGDWDSEVLRSLEGIDGSFRQPPSGLNEQRLLEVADRIEAVTPEELLRVMSQVPVEWGIPSGDLETMGWLLYRRAPAVAQRVRGLASLPTATQTGNPR